MFDLYFDTYEPLKRNLRNDNQHYMFKYTIRKPPDNILDSHSIQLGLTGAVLVLKMTTNCVFELHIDRYEDQKEG